MNALEQLSPLEDQIARALDAAALTIDPTPVGMRIADGSKRRAARWIAPVAAAVAVLTIIAAALIATHQRVSEREIDRAAAVTISAGIADVGGVRFPVPAGWTVAVVSRSRQQIRACVAMSPAAQCDGVTVTMALPTGEPLAQSDVVTCPDGTSNAVIQIENLPGTVGGRPGFHYFGSCSPHRLIAHQWVTLDLGLQILTPAGRYAAQGAEVAGGLDLHDWPRPIGPQLIQWTVGSASTHQ